MLTELQAGSRVGALLGPTNTGKTHRAIERMLEFDSGMMGLPLRLLAREVYDRVSARLGEQAVALVTGEEKRVPAKARYWICTVEAMPRELTVDFVALDEVQLIAHPERGHVFTDRVLHWRGRAETWFMGAAGAESILRSFVPGLFVNRLPRLSRLSHLGASSLRTLPRRSAVVAFNVPQVYELADALTARRGGAAVVLGALSPRVRNAQVALYQAGEVDFLVATDAIGMGLNLDIDHVALAGRNKFDGFEIRELTGSELGQIIGRAGRYLRDGTFGTLAPEPELPPGLVQRLEGHRFPSLQFAYYRNAELDFTSSRALLSSLEKKPQLPKLVAAPDADDLLVLRVLASHPEVIARTRSVHGVQLLWDICRIPNYEKRIPEHQAERLLPLFVRLLDHGQLDTDATEKELARLARFDGDIHQLMDRLSGVRTWSYVGHQRGWVPRAESFRERTRELEDRLGDLLHQRLRERFVRASRVRTGGHAPRESKQTVSGPFAKLIELPLYAALHEGSQQQARGWVEELIEAPFEALRIEAQGELWFGGECVATLVQGPNTLHPELKLRLPDWVAPGSRARISRRLLAHLRDSVNELLAPLHFEGNAPSPALRGLLYQLEQGLGSILRRPAEPQLAQLSQLERELLGERGIVIGRHCVYAADMLTPARRALRCALCVPLLGRELRPLLVAASSELLVRMREQQLPRELWLALGFVPLTSHALRCDVLEDLLRRLESTAVDARAQELRFLLDLDENEAAQLVRELWRKKRRRKRVSSRSS